VPRGLQRRDQEAAAEDELDDRGRDEEPAVDVDHRPGRTARPEHDGHHHQADAERGQRLDQQLATLPGMRVGVDVARLGGRRVARDLVAGSLDRCHDAGAVDDGRVVLDGRPLGGEVDGGGRHPVGTVEEALDAVHAARARHPDDRQGELLRLGWSGRGGWCGCRHGCF
jgi:hypothetical protein